MPHCTIAIKKKITKVKESTEEEKLSSFEPLADSSNSATILRVLSKYSENFIPDTFTSHDVPLILTEVFNEKYTKFNYGQLLIESEIFFYEMINITSQQVEYVLEQTKGQANSSLWFILRAGGMTGSNIRNVSKTNKFVIKQICYRTKFRSVTTDWVCEHNQVGKVSIYYFNEKY